jgi:hypothetical protein
MKRYNRSTFALALLSAVLAVVVSFNAAFAYHVDGKVTNGTTGQPVAGLTVFVADPSAGQELSARTDENGDFRVDGLLESAHVYVLRLEYEGISYSDLVRYSGDPHVHMDVQVYETMESWDNLSVSIPHMMALRDNDTLLVERLFSISNETSPPKTAYGEEVSFEFSLPDDHTKLVSLYVMSLGIPISVHHHPTDEAGVYSISYPLKPGETQFGISFTVPYGDGRYTFSEKLRYDIKELMVFTQNPTLEISSDNVTLEPMADAKDVTAYRATALAKASTLELSFAGGELVDPVLAQEQTQKQAPAASSQRAQVIVVANPTQRAAVVIILGLVLLLIILIAFVAKPAEDAEETTFLLTKKESILSQLARLDDIYATGTISSEVYHLKRKELMNMVAQIVFRTDFSKRKRQRRSRRTRKGPARV